jgi:hypothetical protein
MKKHLSLVAILGLSALNAGEFHALGGNSMSMGGAGVASASGSLAGYYNPALLTQKKGVEVSIGVGLGIRESNIGEQINTLSDMNLNDVVDRIANNAQDGTPKSGQNNPADTKNIVKAQEILSDIGDKNGISIMPTAHLGVQYDNMAIGLYLTSDIVVSANIDKSHLALAVEEDGDYFLYDASKDEYSTIDEDIYRQTSLEYALDNKLTTINVTGLALTEVPVSYAHAFEMPMGELSLGGSLKLMHGTTYIQTLDIDDEDATDEDSLKENQEDSDNIGLDLGLLFNPTDVPKLTVGLVAKNINAPAFDTANGGEIKADLQVRTGVQYRLSDTVEFAGDLDLTSNKTLINGYDSQMFGGGINYHPVSWFALRGGLMQNLANSNEGLVYTAGMAIGLPKFQLDVSAQMASNTGEYDGESIPKYAKVNIALVSKW